MLGDSGSVRSSTDRSRRCDSPSLGDCSRLYPLQDVAFPRSVVAYRRFRGIWHGPAHVDPSLVARPGPRAFQYVGYHLPLAPKCNPWIVLASGLNYSMSISSYFMVTSMFLFLKLVSSCGLLICSYYFIIHIQVQVWVRAHAQNAKNRKESA